jgi:hypothetical protein
MPALDAGIFFSNDKSEDDRIKSGHDDSGFAAASVFAFTSVSA